MEAGAEQRMQGAGSQRCSAGNEAATQGDCRTDVATVAAGECALCPRHDATVQRDGGQDKDTAQHMGAQHCGGGSNVYRMSSYY